MLEVDGVKKTHAPSTKRSSEKVNQDSHSKVPSASTVIEEEEFEKNLKLRKLYDHKEELEREMKKHELNLGNLHEKQFTAIIKILVGTALIVFGVRILVARFSLLTEAQSTILSLIICGGSLLAVLLIRNKGK